MLSDERIIEIMNDAYGFGPDGIEDALSDLTAGDMDAVQSMNGIRNCIRAALAEAAQVPVMGGSGFDSDFIAEAKRVAESLRANGHYLAHGIITALLSSWQTEKAATSITQAELDALRKDAESYRRLCSDSRKLGMQECIYPDCICPDGVSSGKCNLGLPGAPCRDAAVQERQS